jgi:hypothetical protein
VVALPAIEGSAPLARSHDRRKDYNQLVRYYTTKPMDEGVAFKCIVCGHAINTLEFDPAKGNRRTQAAAVMNQHAKELHPSKLRMAAPLMPADRGGY